MTKETTIDPDCLKKLNRDGLLSLSSEMIPDIYDRVKVQRFREREGDSTKLKYLRVLVIAIQAHNSILKDEQLEDIEHRLAALEEDDHTYN
ncbi:hypothetical protein SAMN04488587_1423 [Methanococcoides vulcani]|uniref:DUF8136 domain-containing protein n=1 Tax=Methanococcoides vulcani TaxID=1353158 RepID=A0A1I0A1Z2_9EURY|nr:hypothetical protein [Methanococcoides vulcani]SES87689.1 hypothetical protein SAMN04488587_1423 [Methanococcoides vulcani]